MSTAHGICARDLRKHFGRTAALNGASLDVAPGRITALAGPNGAGKTTLLRILSTALTPDEGTASVNGFDVATQGARVRACIGVALVNDRGLYWRLSGMHNLIFFGRALGLGKREATERARRAAADFGAEAFVERPVAGYSAGQRQRLILARAVLGDPAVLLADEPFRGLDEEGAAGVHEILRAHAQRGATVLVAGPTAGEFAGLADEILQLRDGALQGPVAQVGR